MPQKRKTKPQMSQFDSRRYIYPVSITPTAEKNARKLFGSLGKAIEWAINAYTFVAPPEKGL